MPSLSRRQFGYSATLLAGVLGSGRILTSSAQDLPPAPQALPPPHPAIHLLNRISYGISDTDLERMQALGMVAYFQEQIDPDSIDDRAVDDFISTNFPTLTMTTAEFLSLPREQRNRVPFELKLATLYRRWFSRKQLYEVMVEFWSDHFNIYHNDGLSRFLKTADDRDVIRPHALGRFRELLHASAKSPAMLYYLDNYSNTQSGPNENYARELQELHTLGVDGGFTEQDVLEVARCFTGWSIEPPRNRQTDRINEQAGTFRFYPQRHDNGEKWVLGQRIPANQGIADGEQVLDILAGHPATARFIATKLCRRFVADNPPDSLIDKVAETYIDSDGDIRAMLWTLFASDEFFAAPDEKFKRPVEYLGSLFRTLQVQLDERALPRLRRLLSDLGHSPFAWPPPNGYPDVMTYWASTNGLLGRWNFALDLSSNTAGGFRFDLAALIAAVQTPSQLVDTLSERVLRRPLPPADRELLIAYASEGELIEQAPEVLALLLSSSYFQLR